MEKITDKTPEHTKYEKDAELVMQYMLESQRRVMEFTEKCDRILGINP